MKKKILELLLAKFVGVRKDGLNALAGALSLQCKTDEEAEKMIGTLEKDSVDEFVKEFRSDIDKEVTESAKKIEEKLKKNVEPRPQVEESAEQQPTKTDPKEMTIEERVQAAINAAVKPLTDEISTLKASRIVSTRTSLLDEKLKDCKSEVLVNSIKKNFSRISFESDEDFQTYLTELEPEITSANQSVRTGGLLGLNPTSAEQKKDDIPESVKSYLSTSKNNESDKFSGKEL